MLLLQLFMLGAAMLHSGNAQLTTTTTGPGVTASGCLPYAANCTDSNACCFYPSILCLPDAKNGTSCLSILDVVNLSPAISGANLLGPLVLTTGVGNSTSAVGQVQEVVKVNGNTVYNMSQTITPSTVLSLG